MKIGEVKQRKWAYDRQGELTHLAKRFGTDKYGKVHQYTPLYEHHFDRFREADLMLLELGVGGYDLPDAGGESLRMWKAWMPNATIVGLDVVDKTKFAEDRIFIEQGSQDDPRVIDRLVKRYGPFDIIVDDCSHEMEPTIASFRLLFPHLAPRGWYVIEDLWTSFDKRWGGNLAPLSQETVLKFLVDQAIGLTAEEAPIIHPRSGIASLTFYPDICFIQKA